MLTLVAICCTLLVGKQNIFKRGLEMKKLITILAIMIVLVGAVFADVPANASLDITCVIHEIQPTLTLEGSKDNSTFANAEVAFGTLADDETSITAYFRVAYSAYRWNKSVSVSAAAGDLEPQTSGVTTKASPNSANPTVTDPTKDFSGAAGSAGTFATFSVTYNVASLSSGSYKATVTVTYTVE